VVAVVLPRLVPAEKLRGVQWVGLVIAFAAVALAFSEGFTAGVTPRQLRGDAMALAAGLLWGLTTLVIRASAMAKASAEKTLFYQVAVTAVVAPLLSLALNETWSLRDSGAAWTTLGQQTAIGAFASYLAWMWLLRHYPATQMSSFTFLTPVFALVFGVAVLHEPLTTHLVVALAGVAGGIVLVNRRGRPA
jgi:drug/metabolite transporter (DMT)-like permease